MMARAFITVFCIGVLAHPRIAAAQYIVESIGIDGQYMFAATQEDGVTASYGPGAAAVIQFRPVGPIGLVVVAGIHRMTITQDQAVDRWNWGYWELQWRQETDLLLSDPNFSADQVPVQHALMISGGLMPAVAIGSSRLRAHIAAGPSVTYFGRQLYVDEVWQRYYPDVDETFEMQFRTYAEDKTGFEIGADARVSAAYRVSSVFDLTAGVHYRRLFKETGSEFPLNDLVAFQLGLAFTY